MLQLFSSRETIHVAVVIFFISKQAPWEAYAIGGHRLMDIIKSSWQHRQGTPK
jgi:hypothetical protein